MKQNTKEKLKNDVVDFTSLVGLFLGTMILFGIMNCHLLAIISLLFVYTTTFIYLLRWLYMGIFALYKAFKQTYTKGKINE